MDAKIAAALLGAMSKRLTPEKQAMMRIVQSFVLLARIPDETLDRLIADQEREGPPVIPEEARVHLGEMLGESFESANAKVEKQFHQFTAILKEVKRLHDDGLLKFKKGTLDLDLPMEDNDVTDDGDTR